MIVFFEQAPVCTCHQAPFINLSWSTYRFPAFKLCHASNSRYSEKWVVFKKVLTKLNHSNYQSEDLICVKKQNQKIEQNENCSAYKWTWIQVSRLCSCIYTNRCIYINMCAYMYVHAHILTFCELWGWCTTHCHSRA